ncbi:hypothetical protein RRU01S_02_00610 [Agrobacterium rubi TR3 = NBRC 13261]|uniref:Uncharacterized protein n=1 Tax=Agrobacterium rubi TR3 = NBRC 13261 TaxID=1368415 RepID=A0A081CPY7_9HYPH|nr:hypothetical protein RRU01S_02_00610 [Agrobacterium rubi TR3 = NBRC 13261]
MGKGSFCREAGALAFGFYQVWVRRSLFRHPGLEPWSSCRASARHKESFAIKDLIAMDTGSSPV